MTKLENKFVEITDERNPNEIKQDPDILNKFDKLSFSLLICYYSHQYYKNKKVQLSEKIKKYYVSDIDENSKLINNFRELVLNNFKINDNLSITINEFTTILRKVDINNENNFGNLDERNKKQIQELLDKSGIKIAMKKRNTNIVINGIGKNS